MSASTRNLRFSVLGALRVWNGDDEIGIGASQSRTILALLLLTAGRPITTDDLVDMLWGDGPPSTAVNMIYRTVGILRRVLQPELSSRETGDWLIRNAAGLRIDVTGSNLDLIRFRGLAAAARASANRGDAAAAVDAGVAALSLWEGPIGGVIGSRLSQHPLVVGIDREYLIAARETADAALAADLPEKVLQVLEQAADRHVLDEPLQARLMLLLSAAGRQADALAVHRTVTRRLTDDLGVAPGGDLVRAHETVLRQESRPVQARPVTRRTGRPAQLPPDLATFAGRDAELSRVLALDHPGTVASTIRIVVGMAGVGKTTLAVRWAHLVADHYPDGQIYLNLRGFDPSGRVMPVPDALAFLLHSVGISPAEIPEGIEARTAAFRSRVWGRRLLIVLDNARDVDQVRPLLPGASECTVIVTSRDRLTGLVVAEGAVSVSLDRLTDDGARHLLSRRLGPGWTERDPVAASDIVRICAGLPLALAIVASRAATAPTLQPRDIVAELERSAGSLDAFSGISTGLDARAIFSWSYHLLSPAAARAFRLLSVHPGPEIGIRAAAATLGVTGIAARSVLGELVRANLLTERTPDRYQMHDLLRAYATEQAAAQPADVGEARRRMLAYYVHSAYRSDRVLNPDRTDITIEPLPDPVVPENPIGAAEARQWRHTEQQALPGVVTMAVEYGFDVYAWQLPWALAGSMPLDTELALMRTAVLAAERLGSPGVLARTYSGLAGACAAADRFEEAATYYTRALSIVEDLGDLVVQGDTHLSIAAAYELRGNLEAVQRHQEQASALYDEAGHQPGRIDALAALACLHATRGRYEQALDICRQVDELLGDGGNERAGAANLDTLGSVLSRLGRHTEGIETLREALRRARRTGHRYTELSVRTHLGDAIAAGGDIRAARGVWREALALAQDLDLIAAQAVSRRLAGAETD